jgi:NADPH2:quinone reductase
MPTPNRGEVLVKVAAAGVNFADTMVRRGEYRKDQPLPAIPGMEAAGLVIACGPGVDLEPGQKVALFLEHGGGYASHVVVPSEQAFPVSVDLDARLVAASFLQGVTAWYTVHRYGRVVPGDKVLVTGAAGGLGSWIVQLAADAGASVVGLASTAAKREYLMSLGCASALDPADPEVTHALRAWSGDGFDVVADGVGGALFGAILPALARGGRFIVTGSATQQPAMIDVRHLLPRGQSITGFVVRNVIDEDPREPAAALHEVLSRVADARVRVDCEVLPMSRAADAHVRIEARDVIGKIVLDPQAGL